MRYFFASYSASTTNVKNTTGNLVFGSAAFPSNELLRQEASKKSNHSVPEIVITNLFEFRDREDYECFIRKESPDSKAGSTESQRASELKSR